MALDIEALYRRYGDMVLGRCRTLLGNEADAAEAAQEVFLRLHRSQSSFRGDSSPATWLYRITTNHCLNQLRSRRRRPEDPVEDLSVFVADVVLDAAEARDLLDRLLDASDERTRECVVYHYLDGMTHDEVGALLGLSGAAVRKRLGLWRKDLAARAPAWLGMESL